MGAFQPSRRKSDRPLLQNAPRRRTSLPAQPTQRIQPTLSSSGSGSSAPLVPTSVPTVQTPSLAIPVRPLLRSVPPPPLPASDTTPAPASKSKPAAPAPRTPAFRPSATPRVPNVPPESRNGAPSNLVQSLGLPPGFVPSPHIPGLRELYDLLAYLQQDIHRSECLKPFVNDVWQIYNTKYSKKRKNAETNPSPRDQKRNSSNSKSNEPPHRASETLKQHSAVSNETNDVICLDDDDVAPPKRNDSNTGAPEERKPGSQSQTRVAQKRPRGATESRNSSHKSDPKQQRKDRRYSRQYQLDREYQVGKDVETRFKYFSSKAGRPEQPTSDDGQIYNLWQPSDPSRPVVKLQGDLCSICFRAGDGQVYELHLEALRFLWYYLIENPCSGAVFVHGLGYPRAHLLFVFANLLIGNVSPRDNFKILIVSPDECIYEWEWARACFKTFAQGKILEKQSCYDSVCEWREHGGLLICSFTTFMFMIENDDHELKEQGRKALCDPGPDLFVLDEASRLGKLGERMSSALRSVRTPARLAMTSVPLSSNLARAWSVIEWACPRFLGPRQSFWNTLVRPLTEAISARRDLSSDDEVRQIDRFLRHKLAMVSFGPRFVMREKTLFHCGRYIQESVIHVHMHRGHRREYRRLLNCLAEAIRGGMCSPVVAAHLLSIFASVGVAAFRSVDEECRLQNKDIERAAVGTNPFHASLLHAVLPILENPNLYSMPWAKLDALRLIAGMCMAENERLVVFVFSESLLDEVFRNLGKDASLARKKIHRLNLKEDSSERQKKLQQFNTSEEGVVLVAPYGPSVELMEGAGWCFVNATRIVFLNAIWHNAAYVQAVNRAHNFAQRNDTVYIHHIIATDSIEEALCNLKLSSDPFCSERRPHGQKEDLNKADMMSLKLLPQIPMRFFDEISLRPKDADRAQAKLERRGELMEQWRDHFNFLTPLINVPVEDDSEHGKKEGGFLVHSIDIERGIYQSCAAGLDDQLPETEDVSTTCNVGLHVNTKRADLLHEQRLRLSQLGDITDMGTLELESKYPTTMSSLENVDFFGTEANVSNDIRSSWVEYYRLYESYRGTLEDIPSQSQNDHGGQKRRRIYYERENGPVVHEIFDVTNAYTLTEHI
ncbi:transcriptional regulator ATRX [Gracilaria domingensis]|nr:transcriptional regulator ATRX [Gracilaria domingensis]